MEYKLKDSYSPEALQIIRELLDMENNELRPKYKELLEERLKEHYEQPR